MRESIPTDRKPIRKKQVVCQSCGELKLHEASQRCAVCYQYFRRMGLDRPKYLIIRRKLAKDDLKPCPRANITRLITAIKATARRASSNSATHIKICIAKNRQNAIAVSVGTCM